MTDLSPAAQAVLHAYGNCIGGVDAMMGSERRGLVAALRTAAEAVASPEQADPASQWDLGFVSACAAIYGDLLAIANELESAQ